MLAAFAARRSVHFVQLLAAARRAPLPLLATPGRWSASGRSTSTSTFAIDPLSALMCLIITGVGSLIHIYACSYMETEPAYWRFFTYLNLFVFSMLLLVLGDNFIVMFFGWEGVGLCSYLLIGFWYKDYKKATAGMKAFVVNRVGDWGFICGLGAPLLGPRRRVARARALPARLPRALRRRRGRAYAETRTRSRGHGARSTARPSTARPSTARSARARRPSTRRARGASAASRRADAAKARRRAKKRRAPPARRATSR